MEDYAPVSYTHLDVYKRLAMVTAKAFTTATLRDMQS